ncbi:protein angel homolog 2 [Chrysoperla carnea]|uniref:protein angel homolog 2 n=1 Tax=Chrysoperla carnea TaxID=189513 RepID=UPI001D08584D|nr:protein angel homolog 2 [Chrysoperla carnea]XP_044728650.1 protein angel homolog 2 [Chrysoperla carnea]
MNTPIKSNRKRSRDYKKLSLNKYSNVVVDLTESKVLNKICDQNIKALNNTNISNKKAQISQSVVEISSDSEPEQIITQIKPDQITTQQVCTEKGNQLNSNSKADKKEKQRKRKETQKLRKKLKDCIQKFRKTQKNKSKKKLRKLQRQLLKDNSTFRLEQIVSKLSETLRDRVHETHKNSKKQLMDDDTNKMNLQRAYSDSALQNDSCLSTNMYWQPYTSYLPQCQIPVRNLVDEIGTKKRHKPKPPRTVSVGDLANSANNYIDNVAQEQVRLKGFRQWTDTDYGKMMYKSGRTGGLLFKLMSYNVLAQILLTQHAYLYRQHDPRALFWEHRKFALLNEFLEHDADILCLQEVEKTHLDFYRNNLEGNLGYKGMFKSRTGVRNDGCAMYYKENKFNLIYYDTVEYFQPDVELLNRENIAIIARFSDKSNPSNEFVVATTHLLYNPRRQDVRLAQTQLLLTEIDRIAFKKFNEKNQPEYVPIIITGDFNLEPYTAVYNLLVNGELDFSKLTRRQLKPPTGVRNEILMEPRLLPPRLRITDHCQHVDIAALRRSKEYKMDFEKEKGLIQLEHSGRSKKTYTVPQSTVNNYVRRDNVTESNVLFSTGKLTHGFNLKSVYSHDNRATTYQDRWINVDYIFYSAKSDQRGNQEKSDGRLKLVSKFQLPTANECKKLPSIPNLVFGSDHLSLAAQFLLEDSV